MIIDFLKNNTEISGEDFAAALNVLREFRRCESDDEYLSIDFSAWAKFEQFQEFLEYLVNGKELQEDTIAFIEYAEVAPTIQKPGKEKE